MRHARTIIAAGLSAALLAVSASSADARWGHRGYYGHAGYYAHGGHYGRGGYYGGGPGLVGGAVIGALTLATLPFALLGAATSPAPPPLPRRAIMGLAMVPRPTDTAPLLRPVAITSSMVPLHRSRAITSSMALLRRSRAITNSMIPLHSSRATTSNMGHRLAMVGSTGRHPDITTATDHPVELEAGVSLALPAVTSEEWSDKLKRRDNAERSP